MTCLRSSFDGMTRLSLDVDAPAAPVKPRRRSPAIAQARR
jgi:hypothetical protein